MDRLEELRVFVAVTDSGSLAAAGRRLGHSAPAVTRMIAALEDRLGVRLVARTTRHSTPTDAGLRLAEQARRLLADYAEAVESAAGEAAAPRGVLRMAAPLVFGRLHVAPLVAEFLASHPAVTAELVLGDAVVDLVEEGFDLACRIGVLAESSLLARRVGATGRMVAASPAYLARHGLPANPAALASHAVIHFGRGGPVTEWRFEGGIAVRVQPRLAVNGAEAAIAAAIAGHGLVMALGYQLAAALEDRRLVRVLAAHEPPPLPVALVFPSARLLPRRVRAFLDLAAPRLAAVLPG